MCDNTDIMSYIFSPLRYIWYTQHFRNWFHFHHYMKGRKISSQLDSLIRANLIRGTVISEENVHCVNVKYHQREVRVEGLTMIIMK